MLIDVVHIIVKLNKSFEEKLCWRYPGYNVIWSLALNLKVKVDIGFNWSKKIEKNIGIHSLKTHPKRFSLTDSLSLNNDINH